MLQLVYLNNEMISSNKLKNVRETKINMKIEKHHENCYVGWNSLRAYHNIRFAMKHNLRHPFQFVIFCPDHLCMLGKCFGLFSVVHVLTFCSILLLCYVFLIFQCRKMIALRYLNTQNGVQYLQSTHISYANVLWYSVQYLLTTILNFS